MRINLVQQCGGDLLVRPIKADDGGDSAKHNHPMRPDDSAELACRPGCAACCIAPSISSAIPGMPHGKPAGIRCVQLTEGGLCALFGSPLRPAVCGSLRPAADMCGSSREHAIQWLSLLEAATQAGAAR